MPNALVAIWQCNTRSTNYQRFTMTERLDIYRDAVDKAHARMKALNFGDGITGLHCIFVAPEYAFAAAEPKVFNDNNDKKPAQHTTKGEYDSVASTSNNLTKIYPTMLLIPGTTAYAVDRGSGYGGTRYEAWNAATAHYGNATLTEFGKRVGVGEISTNDRAGDVPRMRFMGGAGYGTFTTNGHTYGMEICKDSTGDGTLPNTVDIHVVVGQGVGVYSGMGSVRDHIAHKGTQYLIVADDGSLTVLDRTGGNRVTRDSVVGGVKAKMGTRLHYFTITL